MVKITCKKCGRESIVEPADSGMVNFQSGPKKLLRLVCPHCHRAEWKREETLRAAGKIVDGGGAK